MKSVKIASLLLASGMLLGSVHSAVTPAYTAHAAQEQVVPNSDPVNLEGKVYVAAGVIMGFSQGMNSADLQKIFDGGELVIPEKIGRQTITGIKSNLFNKTTLEGTYPALNGLSGIAKLTFNAPEKISYIGENAFNGNAIQGNLSLSKARTINDGAFNGNDLTSINLPKARTIGENAFEGNNLMNITLSESPRIGGNAFSNQTPKLSKDANERGQVSFDELVPSLKMGDNKLNIAVSDVSKAVNQPESGNSENSKIDNSNRVIELIDSSKSAVVNLMMEVEEVSTSRVLNSGDYSINPMQLTINGIAPSPIAPPTNGGNNEGNTSTTPDTNPDVNTPDTGNNESPIAISPDPDVNRPHTVYAKRAMRLHSNVSLTNPTKSYKKQSRAKAASFRIQGVSYDNNGKKRYKVKGGYITASTKYVADSHFRSSKVKQVRVIGNKVNSYKNAKLSKSQQVRSYKKGTKLKVKRIVKQGRTTRFQLNNGRYITGNKQLLIMDHSK